MNLKACLTLLVLTALLPIDTEASWFRRALRKVGEVISDVIKPVCQSACPKVCPQLGEYIGLPDKITEVGCHIGCQKLCKRSIPDFVMSDVTYRVVPMSTDFSHYDLNGDKLITPEEFSRAEKLPLEEVYDIFKFADVDDAHLHVDIHTEGRTARDNMLDMDEFETAPFVFTNDMAARINSMMQGKNGRKKEAEAYPTKLSTPFTAVVHDMNNANISINETTPYNITSDTAALA